jgi:transcriptional regulator with AAA-type ATPase domain
MAYPLSEDDQFKRDSKESLPSALTCPILIGRVREVQQLDQALRTAHAGLGHSVLIAGEAGVGKSRLLAEMSPDFAKLSAIGAKYGIDILGPLPPADFHA